MRPDVLLLQGPVGPFFKRLSVDLEARGFRVHKVNLNGGDRFFYGSGERAIDYTGDIQHWGAFLERYIVNNAIGRIYLFGDCRSYHRIARQVAEQLDVRVFVFEEGYIRPNFITLEEGGVNGHSSMLRRDFSIPPLSEVPASELQPTQNTFFRVVMYSVLYYLTSSIQAWRFPNYQHHRDLRWLPEGLRWLYSGARKWLYQRRERHVLGELIPQFDKNYFVVPLQVHCDMQVVVHSGYNSIEHFIGEVLTSFARYAPENKAIVFKHHPLDRAYTDYSTLFTSLVSELGLHGRVFYVHDVCLETLLNHAQGTVLINSTVGMQSLSQGTPVRALGKAIYDLPGLTSKTPLKGFWRSRETVDRERFMQFRNYLISRNQLNGSLYQPLSHDDSSAGLIWSSKLLAEHTFRADRPDTAALRPLRVVGGRDTDQRQAGYRVSGRDDDAAAA